MKYFLPLILILLSLSAAYKNPIEKKMTPLFDGKTFAGWEGDTLNTWRIEDGAIIGGSLLETVPHNDFLSTTRTYGNFILKLKIKLTGTDGFINSGIQFHSRRMTDPAHEMIGYQADWGEGYWAGLYDESRRNITLMKPDSLKILSWIHENEWNDYEIRTENNRIRLYINGHQTIDYTETDPDIPQSGLIAFQIHGGGKAMVAIKEIYIEERP